ncbi:unnamed protein product [Arctogadus glacialis]
MSNYLTQQNWTDPKHSKKPEDKVLINTGNSSIQSNSEQHRRRLDELTAMIGQPNKRSVTKQYYSLLRQLWFAGRKLVKDRVFPAPLTRGRRAP